MLTQASELAVRALVVLALEDDGQLQTPQSIAARMDCSASYLSKVLGALTRAEILVAARGARGGVRIARSPESINLLEIVEACDGFLVANYCRSLGTQPDQTCGFHVAMHEIHETLRALLTRWRLSDLLEVPVSQLPDGSFGSCKMQFEGCGCHLPDAEA